MQASLATAGIASMLLISSGILAQPDPNAGPHRPVRLISRTFTPNPESGFVAKNGDHVFVQLRRTPRESEWSELSRRGIRLLEFVEGLTYLAVIDGKTVSERSAGREVRWIGRLTPDDKIAPVLLPNPVGTSARDAEPVAIAFHRDISTERAGVILRAQGIAARRSGVIWLASLTREAMSSLAQHDAVRSISEGPPPFLPLLSEVRSSLGIDAVQGISVGTPVPTFSGLSGRGVTIGVIDSHFDLQHDDFWDHDSAGARTGSRLMFISATPGNSLHGTHVASIAAGNGFRSDKFSTPTLPRGPYLYRGVAPEASIYAGEYDLVSPYTAFGNAINKMKSDVINNSYALTCGGYNDLNVALDAVIRGSALDDDGVPIARRPAVFAAGNNGTRSTLEEAGCIEQVGYYSVLNPAKNAITVGASELNKVFGGRAEFSSIGPTDDGRIKPDLVAPGGNLIQLAAGLVPPRGIIAAFGGGENSYAGLPGTSQAAPVVTGTIALMLQEWRKYRPAASPLPSSFKAALLQTAIDMVDDFDGPAEAPVIDTGARIRYGAGPDWATGYGLVNPSDAVRVVTEDRVLEDVIENNGAGRTSAFLIDVPAGAADLKVTIAWDDLAEATLMSSRTAPKLVNDLDLTLVDPAGKIYRPLVLPVPPRASSGSIDPIPAAQLVPAFPGEDHLNNVEQVVVSSPPPGRWSAKVVANVLPTGTDQPYSIASNLAFLRPIKVSVPRKLPCGSGLWDWGLGRGSGVICLAIPIRKLCLLTGSCEPCRFGRCADLLVRRVRDPLVADVRLLRRDREVAGSAQTLARGGDYRVPAAWASEATVQVIYRTRAEGHETLPVAVSSANN